MNHHRGFIWSCLQLRFLRFKTEPRWRPQNSVSNPNKCRSIRGRHALLRKPNQCVSVACASQLIQVDVQLPASGQPPLLTVPRAASNLLKHHPSRRPQSAFIKMTPSPDGCCYSLGHGCQTLNPSTRGYMSSVLCDDEDEVLTAGQQRWSRGNNGALWRR